MRILAVGSGGMIGTLLRAVIYSWVPMGIGLWAVNLVGSFLLGFVVSRIMNKSAELRLFVTTGLIGSFTTFSTFSADWFVRLEQSLVQGLAFGLGMTICSVAFAATGLWLGRRGRML